MDLGPNPSVSSSTSGDNNRGSPRSAEVQKYTRSQSESEVYPRERRKDKYRVKDEGSEVSDVTRSQRGAGFEGLCLGPGAYDNLTFKDDNGQLELTKIRAKDELRSRMNSKTKVLHKSHERLIVKVAGSGHDHLNGNGNIYEKARHSPGKSSSSATPSPHKTSKSTSTSSPSSKSKLQLTSSNSQPAVNGEAESHDVAPPDGVVPDSPKVIQIPWDGNLQNFSADDMTVFFRDMNIDELIVQRLKRKKLDGKKFARLRDADLEDLGITNPIICYFRDRSKRQRMGFML